MIRPNIENFRYSNGDMRDLTEYAEEMEKYSDFLEEKYDHKPEPVESEVTDEVAFEYLIELRDSGVVNMWGAAPYVAKEFGISETKAGHILVRWIESFKKK